MDVTSGRATLVCSDGGSGDPATLLLHAGVTDRRSWQHLTPLLPGRWVSFDARGFGETTYQPEDGWSPVDDAVAVLDAYGIERAVVVAASLGGRTALDLALAHPDRVEAVALIGPAVSGAPRPEVEAEIRPLVDAADRAEEAGEVDELNRCEAHLFLDGPLQPEGRVGGPTRDLFLQMNRIALAAPDPGEQREDAGAWERVDEIAVPTLVLIGEHDLGFLRRRAEHVAAGVRDGRLVELSGVAHLPHLEGDRPTLEAIAAFVGEH